MATYRLEFGHLGEGRPVPDLTVDTRPEGEPDPMSVYHPPIEEHETVIKAALRVIAATHYSRADDPYADAESEYAEEQLALSARELARAVDRKPADEQPIGWAKDVQVEHDAIHKHFSLSYANYLVLPRTLLQSMPDGWQTKLVSLLGEFDDAFGHVPQPDAYIVQAAEEKEAYDLDVAEREAARVAADGDEDSTTYTHTSLIGERTQLDPDDHVLVPVVDPVPHYNRGRTRVEPRPGGGQ